MTISLAEELVLLAYDDDGIAYGTSAWLDYGVAGAHLVELALAERIGIRDKTVQVLEPAPTGSPLADAALERIASDSKRRKPDNLIYRLSRGARKPVLAGLVAKGILEKRADRLLRIFPITRYSAPHGVEPAVETERRRLMRLAIEDRDSSPDARTLALCTLVGALGWEKRVFPDLPRRETKRRLEELSESQWAGVAVGRLVRDLQAALITATVAASAAAAAGAA